MKELPYWCFETKGKTECCLWEDKADKQEVTVNLANARWASVDAAGAKYQKSAFQHHFFAWSEFSRLLNTGGLVTVKKNKKKRCLEGAGWYQFPLWHHRGLTSRIAGPSKTWGDKRRKSFISSGSLTGRIIAGKTLPKWSLHNKGALKRDQSTGGFFNMFSVLVALARLLTPQRSTPRFRRPWGQRRQIWLVHFLV